MPDPENLLRLTVTRRNSGNSQASKAFEVNAEVTEVLNLDSLDINVFVFQKGVPTTQGDAMSFFVGVASMHQVSTFRSHEPDNLEAQENPYWRSSSTGFLSFSSSGELERFLEVLISEISNLEMAAEFLNSGASEEVYVISGGVASMMEEA